MIKKLLYGPHEVRLRDDEDVAALAQRILDATADLGSNRGDPKPLSVTVRGGDTWHLIPTPGVAIAITTSETAPPRALIN